jgi:hypothetical protein
LSLGGVEGTWVRYWDESSTVAVLEFKVDEPAHLTTQPKDKKEKKKAKGRLYFLVQYNSFIKHDEQATLKATPRLHPSFLPRFPYPINL